MKKNLAFSRTLFTDRGLPTADLKKSSNMNQRYDCYTYGDFLSQHRRRASVSGLTEGGGAQSSR